MAATKNRKQLIKAIVLTVGVADCVGIYLANHRLGQPVPDEVRYDMAAYALPTGADTFRTQPAMFADAAPAIKAVPALAAAQPAKAAPSPAPRLAAARTAAPKAEGPRSSSVSRMLAALQPAARTAAAPVPAPARAAVVTPHLAKVETPSGPLRTAGAKIASPVHTASLVADHAAPAKASVHRAPAKAATSLAGLVPKARGASEFASAFAGFDAPLAAGIPVENALPGEAAPGAASFATNEAGALVLESIVPEAAPAAEPMSAAADTAQAAL